MSGHIPEHNASTEQYLERRAEARVRARDYAMDKEKN
jgi:hypothetical protein